ncbi:MAG: class I tRNA ligase family protein, partial [Gammaproteobacteria bacterium]|nr:class I tRNA ligase family protein [Gammaproteobacteria bacterium]
CNKLWNAARYVFMNTEGEDCGIAGESSGHSPASAEIERSAADRWILSRLQKTKRAVAEAIESYRFDYAAQALYEFTWNEYCDWYLELSKPVLTDPDASVAAKRGTRRTLVRVLEALLRMTHPIMPFITEEIWQKAGPLAGASGETVMTRPFPSYRQALIDEPAEQEIAWVRQFILGIRKIKGEMNIAPGKQLPVLLQNPSESDLKILAANRHCLDFLARLERVEVLPEGADAPESATALVGGMKVLIPMAGLIDKEAELARLQKEIARIDADLQRMRGKLSNASFVERAPQAVVQKERDKLATQEAARLNLEEQLVKIQNL